MLASRNAHLIVDELPGQIVRVTRTTEGFASLHELEHVWTQLNLQLDGLPRRHYCLLFDSRDAPPRNDPEFEHAFVRLRSRLVSGFQRSAVLVRTAVGRLQIQRHLRENLVTVAIFADEQAALAYLTARQ